jgi:hypothetical protein
VHLVGFTIEIYYDAARSYTRHNLITTTRCSIAQKNAVPYQLKLYKQLIAVCSQIHTKHINTLRGQNVKFLNVKLVVSRVTTGSDFRLQPLRS